LLLAGAFALVLALLAGQQLAPAPASPGPPANPVAVPAAVVDPVQEQVDRAATRLAAWMRPLAPGERPPQFVLFSFDGAGSHLHWRRILDLTAASEARVTGFLSGIYLVPDDERARYRAPGHPAGRSAIGFGGSQNKMNVLVSDLNDALRRGHEIGTHYNGHFCGAGGVGTWTGADWSHELDQFDALVFGHGPKLPFRTSEIVGGRTPCLEGNLDALYPVLAERGFRYDASRTALLGSWPAKRLGIWSFPLLELPFIGHTFRVVSMDYNFMANQTNESPARIENETYRTLWNAFRASYLGNRAPLSLGNHFETWESWAYDHALSRFLLRACRLPEVRCSSFAELANWLDAQRPKRLARFRAGRFPHAPPGLNRS
jgi:hypothetical protein